MVATGCDRQGRGVERAPISTNPLFVNPFGDPIRWSASCRSGTELPPGPAGIWPRIVNLFATGWGHQAAGQKEGSPTCSRYWRPL